MIQEDDEIRIQYEFDQGHMGEEDKSLFLLPFDVQINQKRRWVESVDLAYNAWLRAKVTGKMMKLSFT